MDRMMNEMSLRAAPMALGDEELMAVTGAGHRECHDDRGLHLGWGRGRGEQVTQSNTIGDITIYAPNNSGTINVTVTQSNAA